MPEGGNQVPGLKNSMVSNSLLISLALIELILFKAKRDLLKRWGVGSVFSKMREMIITDLRQCGLTTDSKGIFFKSEAQNKNFRERLQSD